jgi:hypothetical protein
MRESITMRLRLTAVVTAILTIAAVTFAQAKDLSGRWTGTFNRRGSPVTLVLNLRVSDNQVTGELADPGGNKMPIQNWKLEGNQLTFEVSAKEHGRPRTDHFVGVVEDDSIKLLEHNNQKYEPPITFHRNQE